MAFRRRAPQAHHLLLALFAGLVFSACSRGVRPDEPGAPNPPSAATPDAAVDQPRGELQAILAQVQASITALDAALWVHWTSGAPLELAKVTGPSDALLSKETVGLVRRAREQGALGERRLRHLEHWLIGELLAKATAEEDSTVANLEATAPFAVDGREWSWRELPRALANERSAVKRRALWAASLAVAERLDAALARREAKAKDALSALDVPSPLEFAAEARELDLESLARAADAVLLGTDVAWRDTLRRLSDAELKLPVDKLSRADLPRLLRPPAKVDAAFPRGQIASRGIQTLGSLGLYGRPGLTLDLSEAAKKNPLPLTVGAPGDVRLSFRPVGGLYDQAKLLSHLGQALALQHVTTGQLETSRLGSPMIALVTGELFASLVAEVEWLTEMGVPSELHDGIAWSYRASQLHAARRAAGLTLCRLETEGLTDVDARNRSLEITGRAFAIQTNPRDGLRWRTECDDSLRAATSLYAALWAEGLRRELGKAGPRWWHQPGGQKLLQALWAPGTSRSPETALGPVDQALASWVSSQAGASPPSLASPDAGPQPPKSEPPAAMLDAGATDGGRGPQMR